MTARWLTFTGWAVPGPMAALAEWVASRWAGKRARPRGLRVDAAPRSTRAMPSGPHPHASATLSLWSQVELLSRM
jgi:hypothetical protein